MSATLPTRLAPLKEAETGEIVAQMLEGAQRQMCLRETLSEDELIEYRRSNSEEFLRIRERMSTQAAANGLTDEILAGILAER
jgi:hypothetical protein